MSDQPRPGSEALSPSRVYRIEGICDRFEDAWQAGQRPQIENYLGEVPERERPGLWRELLQEIIILPDFARRALVGEITASKRGEQRVRWIPAMAI